MFAENNKISHRQLRRQIVLSLTAPFLLCLAGQGNVRGINGIAGILIAAVFLVFSVSFLMYVAPACENLQKNFGKVWCVIIVGIFLVYILFTAAYVLDLVSTLSARWLLPGVSEWYIRIAIAAVCAAGSHKGIQKRARIGEVSFRIVIGALIVLIVLAFVQGDHFSINELQRETFEIVRSIKGGYETFCAFLPLALLPFLLSGVSGSSGSRRAVWEAVAVLSSLLIAVLILLPLDLGWERMVSEPMPILPLLTGTNLPGDVLARFDVVWIALLIYALLYSLGSLFYYGSHIPDRISLPVNRWLLAAAVLLISCDPLPGYSVSRYYRVFLMRFAAPAFVLLIISICFCYRRKCV